MHCCLEAEAEVKLIELIELSQMEREDRLLLNMLLVPYRI